MSSDAPHYKVILVGNSGVGKTALVERVSEDLFQNSHVPTVGAQFVSLELTIAGRPCVLDLWDTAGQEVFRSLVGFYARDAKGAFVLFDVAAQQSFDDLGKWVEFVSENAPAAKIIVFGNKIDLEGAREVTTAQGRGFAEKHSAVYYEGSAKTGENVSEAFDRVTELMATRAALPQHGVELKAEKKKKGREGCC
jgi:small GTP-binding protein